MKTYKEAVGYAARFGKADGKLIKTVSAMFAVNPPDFIISAVLEKIEGMIEETHDEALAALLNKYIQERAEAKKA